MFGAGGRSRADLAADVVDVFKMWPTSFSILFEFLKMCVFVSLQTHIVSQLLKHKTDPTLLNCNQDKPSGTYTHTHTHTHTHTFT